MRGMKGKSVGRPLTQRQKMIRPASILSGYLEIMKWDPDLIDWTPIAFTGGARVSYRKELKRGVNVMHFASGNRRIRIRDTRVLGGAIIFDEVMELMDDAAIERNVVPRAAQVRVLAGSNLPADIERIHLQGSDGQGGYQTLHVVERKDLPRTFHLPAGMSRIYASTQVKGEPGGDWIIKEFSEVLQTSPFATHSVVLGAASAQPLISFFSLLGQSSESLDWITSGEEVLGTVAIDCPDDSKIESASLSIDGEVVATFESQNISFRQRFDQPGNYRITLSVTFDSGESDACSRWVCVLPPEQSAAIKRSAPRLASAVVCPKCGKVHPAEWSYCPYDGTKLPASSTESEED